jgi:PEP-CTERM motif
MKLQTLVFAGLLVCAGSANAGVLYSQPWDGGSNLLASQNDTTGGNGNFATVYDQFTLSSASDVEDLEWTGGYFNPPNQGPITAWTITFYANNAGAPGAVLNTLNFTNTGNETFVGNVNDFPIYTYSETFPSYDLAAGTYFVSVVPDLGFPPQWGWATGTGGANSAYQTFFGSTNPLDESMAFDVTGSAIPEPSTWVMMVAGFTGLGFAAFRARRSAVAVA